MSGKNEKEIAKHLVKLGYGEPLSKVMTFFLVHKEGTSLDIERKMNMRQPEVSVALSNLMDRKCLVRTKIMSERKGRPKYFYQMKEYPNNILNIVENEINEKVNTYTSSLKAVKEAVHSL